MIGTWCLLPSPEVVDVVCKTAIDFVIIDREHGSADMVTTHRMIQAAKSNSKLAFCRASELNEVEILKIIDGAPDGIMVPHIETGEDAYKVVKYSSFPPLGKRGFSPYVRSANYHPFSEYMQQTNRDLKRMIVIESTKAMDNLDDILKFEIDVVYIGAYDLSVSCGYPGDIQNPVIQKMISDCTKKIRNSGKMAGAMYHNKEQKEKLHQMGINFLVYKVDTSIIYEGYQNNI